MQYRFIIRIKRKLADIAEYARSADDVEKNSDRTIERLKMYFYFKF